MYSFCMKETKHYSIIGSGPVGASLTILLARAGNKIDLFEKLEKYQIKLAPLDFLYKGVAVKIPVS